MPHEGIDLCYLTKFESRMQSGGLSPLTESGHRNNGELRCRGTRSDESHSPPNDLDQGTIGEQWSVPVGFRVPALADGEVVAIFGDFIAHTIIVKHAQHAVPIAGAVGAHVGWPLYSLLAHVKPEPWVMPGVMVKSCDPAVATVAPSTTSAPQHIHLSMLAATEQFPWTSVADWPTLIAFSAEGQLAFIEPPIQFSEPPVQPSVKLEPVGAADLRWQQQPPAAAAVAVAEVEAEAKHEIS